MLLDDGCWAVLRLLLLGYAPGLLLPVLMALFPGNIGVIWGFYVAWTVYLFILLYLQYRLEKKGGGN